MSTFRIHQLFRRVTGGSSPSPEGVKPDPVRELGSVGRRTQGIQKISHCGGRRTPCDRDRLRRRRQWRSCFSPKPSNGVKVGTVNVQALDWQKFLHRPQLQDLIRSVRSRKLDVVFLSDLAVRPELSVAYIEDFCLVCQGRVGVLMRGHLAAAWERFGRRTFSLGCLGSSCLCRGV